MVSPSSTRLETIRTRLFDAARANLEKKGFHARNSNSLLFVRDSGDYRDLLQLILSETPRSVSVLVDAGVRSNVIEDLYHTSSEFTGDNRNYTATIGGNIADFLGESLPSFEIMKDADIQTFVGRLNTLIEDKIEKYVFAKYHSLESIDSALNGSPEQLCKEMKNDHCRCSKGLIVAKLLHRTDYDYLLAIYDARMRNWGNRIYDTYFIPLVRKLAAM